MIFLMEKLQQNHHKHCYFSLLTKWKLFKLNIYPVYMTLLVCVYVLHLMRPGYCYWLIWLVLLKMAKLKLNLRLSYLVFPLWAGVHPEQVEKLEIKLQ